MGNWLTLSHLSQKGQQKTMSSAQTKQQKLARLQQKKLLLKVKNQFHRQNTTGEGGASPDNAIKTIARYLYHLQAAHYLEVTKASEFYFVFVEKVYPFAVGVYSLDDDTIAEGRALRFLALKQISQCHTDNYWRGYSESVETLSLPNWAYLTN